MTFTNTHTQHEIQYQKEVWGRETKFRWRTEETDCNASEGSIVPLFHLLDNQTLNEDLS